MKSIKIEWFYIDGVIGASYPFSRYYITDANQYQYSAINTQHWLLNPFGSGSFRLGDGDEI